MHRSHTSLVAHAFMEAGLYLGDDLIGAKPSNPYGHFESQAIVDFHDSVIRQHNLGSWWSKVDLQRVQSVSKNKALDDAFSQAWTGKEQETLCGWKDPRGALFLDTWSRVVPTAKFIITVRHPIQVVRSLNKRVLRSSKLKWKPMLSKRHFNHWLVTNTLILDWVRRHPDQSYLLRTPQDLLDEKHHHALRRRLSAWEVDIDVRFDQVIDSSLIDQTTVDDEVSRMYKNRTDIQDVYRQLMELMSAQD